jgi:glycosyltransferase involved in cell wall biosynthesis
MISVIMSVYNAEKYLEEAVDSILNQTYQDFEFIIINDFSNDRSTDILVQYEKRFSNIKLIHNSKNLGLTKNLNLAISIAKGEFIARMDADDISEKNRFERQIEYFKIHKELDIIGTYSYDIDEKGEIIRKRTTPVNHKNIVKIMPMFCPMSHPTIMFKKNSLAKIGFYNEKYRTSQDLEMYFRAAGAGLKFANIPEYLFKYRIDDEFLKRKSFLFRWNDYKLRMEGFKYINLPWYKYSYALIPIILGILPRTLFNSLKKIDPR